VVRGTRAGNSAGMPKSRNHRKSRKPRSQPQPAAVPAPGHRLDMRLVATMAAADDAEARGDAAGALEIMSDIEFGPDGKPFWRPWRVQRLCQLVTLQNLLPPWAASRWILAQACQSLDFRAQSLAAMDLAVKARGGLAVLPGTDSVDRRCKVMDHDWLYRQAFLYDLGGLRRFLTRRASGDLVAGADQINAWCRASMGGYRLLRKSPRTLTWEDLATRRHVDVLNLGGAALIEIGECAIGRVVPIRGGEMFETAPLGVPGQVAEAVASSPSSWIETITAACHKYGVGPRRDGMMAAIQLSGLHDFGMLTDVPQTVWRTGLEPERVRAGKRLSTDPESVFTEALEHCGAGLRLVEQRDDPELVDAWPELAAALVEPGVLDALSGLARPEWKGAWSDLAELLPEPAAAICFQLAVGHREAA